ncbi:MAG: hypothetical protein U5J63_15830 [Fodinibius sp.]|nr:hypothetical protein [Fodinibius sp.]
MDLQAFATKWFLFYYCILGLLLLSGGLFLVLKNNRAGSFLQDAACHEKPPRILIKILKYLALFTLPGLILSFFPSQSLNFCSPFGVCCLCTLQEFGWSGGIKAADSLKHSRRNYPT